MFLLTITILFLALSLQLISQATGAFFGYILANLQTPAGQNTANFKTLSDLKTFIRNISKVHKVTEITKIINDHVIIRIYIYIGNYQLGNIYSQHIYVIIFHVL